MPYDLSISVGSEKKRITMQSLEKKMIKVEAIFEGSVFTRSSDVSLFSLDF